MARLTGPTAVGVAALTQHFNTIMGAIEQGATVQQLWQAVQQASELANTNLAGASIFDMNYVAGAARSILSGEANLAAAESNYALDSSMWGWAPWASGQADSWLQDRYQVRYQATMTGPGGEQVPVWGVTDWEGSLEGLTKGQLYDRAITSAQESLDTESPRVVVQLGGAEGFSFGGLTRVQVMRL